MSLNRLTRPKRVFRGPSAIGALLCTLFLAGTPAPAQDPPVETAAAAQLASQQEQLAERYRKVEEVLLRLADVEAAENPERAALLRRAARQSRDKFILDRLQGAAGSLSTQEFQQALDNQKAAQQELASLLKLLMTEDRPQRIREEKERIANIIKDLKRMERGERSTRARTENGADLEEVQKEQQSITDRARDVESELGEEEFETESESQPSESQPSESQPSESQPSESQPSESQPSESQPSESQPSESQPSESQPSESQPSESQPSESQPSESQPSESQPSESQPSESQPSESEPSESQPSESQPSESQPNQQPATPKQAAQDAVEKARRQMEKAEQRLEEAKRGEAVEAQRQAEQELREAIEKLEQILRQLREEEMLRELARLESRLRQMAQMQSAVLDKTRQLALTAVDQRDRQTDIRAGNLALDEKKIVLEADRASLLLREEGSSVAFPEVVQQMRDDMSRVADRLAQTKIDEITQAIQEDILAALEEMISALQQAQRDLEKQQQEQQQQPAQQGQPGEQPLVQPLAELKLIRTMQTRIKSITERYGEMIEERADGVDEDMLGLLRSLSDRQQKLYRVTRDLLLKRNN